MALLWTTECSTVGHQEIPALLCLVFHAEFEEDPLLSVRLKERIKINENDCVDSDLIYPRLVTVPYTTKTGLIVD